MNAVRSLRLLPILALLAPVGAAGQGTPADYARANGLRASYDGLTVNVTTNSGWIGKTHRLWYRRTVRGGAEFVVYDVDTRQKQTPFDHAKLAAALSSATKKSYTAITLPFNSLSFSDDERTLDVNADDGSWKCSLKDYVCRKDESDQRTRSPFTPRRPQDTRPRPSPDGKWEAIVDNYNVAVREKGSRDLVRLSLDGSEGNRYEIGSIAWSPDSKKLAAYRVKPGYQRDVHYVESSPEDQLQPKDYTLRYAKPGDVLDVQQPVVFDVAAKTAKVVDNALFPDAYSMSRLEWRKDGHAVTFEYNQRGHQVYRVIEVDAATGRPRVVVSEEPKTFFNYRTANGSLADSGKKYRFDVADGREMIWMSERDGWNHLYLLDTSGAVKNQITKGAWPVRGVLKVDETARQIVFSACGMYPGRDPYFLNVYRINFDGTGLTRLNADVDANHNVAFSDDLNFFVDQYSRIDMATIAEVRATADGALVAQLERGDIARFLTQAGARPKSSSPKAATASPTSGA